MKICRRCVAPETRPGITFDEEGVCFPCRVAERQAQVDWRERRAELEAIAQWAKQTTRCGYDCIVGVSGGKDSLRQSLYARDELGLKPLLVSSTYPPEQLAERGARNLSNLIRLGFDTLTVGPGPEKWKELMKRAFQRFGNWAKSTEMALYATPPRIALAYGIPLILLGENAVLTCGDLGGSLSGDANRIRYNHTLAGGDPKELLGEGVTRRDAFWFTFPSEEEMEKAQIQILYLGFYIRDFDPWTNGEIAIRHGLEVREDLPEETGALLPFEDLDEDFVHVNQMLKFFKYGLARVADQVSQAIRLGRMSREEALELVRRYDGRCAEHHIRHFCRYLRISWEEFWEVADRYRNPALWERNGKEEWCLRES